MSGQLLAQYAKNNTVGHNSITGSDLKLTIDASDNIIEFNNAPTMTFTHTSVGNTVERNNFTVDATFTLASRNEVSDNALGTLTLHGSNDNIIQRYRNGDDLTLTSINNGVYVPPAPPLPPPSPPAPPPPAPPPPSPPPPVPPPPSPPQPPSPPTPPGYVTVSTVSATLGLAGYTSSTFAAAAVRSDFASSVAAVLNVSQPAVAIASVTDYTVGASGRRLLVAGVQVAFVVTVPSPAAAASVAAALTAVVGSPSALQSFTTTLQAAGLSALSGLELIAGPTVATVVVAAPTSTATSAFAAPWRYLVGIAVAVLSL